MEYTMKKLSMVILFVASAFAFVRRQKTITATKARPYSPPEFKPTVAVPDENLDFNEWTRQLNVSSRCGDNKKPIRNIEITASDERLRYNYKNYKYVPNYKDSNTEI